MDRVLIGSADRRWLDPCHQYMRYPLMCDSNQAEQVEGFYSAHKYLYVETRHDAEKEGPNRAASAVVQN